jgi:outer membrane lipoprotein-sorting protein
MKKSFSLILTCVTLFLIQGQAQTADEIINKHYEARGGIEKLRALQSMIMQGTMVQVSGNAEMKYYFVQGKAMKMEFTSAGQSGYNIITEKGNWMYNPSMPYTYEVEYTEDQLKDVQSNLDFQGPLVDYKSKGNTVEYLGKENSQGLEYYKLKLTRANGKKETYYLDKNYLIAKLVSTTLVQEIEKEVTTEYSDYRKTPEGYVISFKVVDRGLVTSFNKVEINPKIDESVFKPSN